MPRHHQTDSVFISLTASEATVLTNGQLHGASNKQGRNDPRCGATADLLATSGVESTDLLMKGML